MAGEEENLMRLGEIADGLQRVSRACGSEVDEDIIENDGKRIGSGCVFANQSKTHGEIELLGGSPAEQLRRQANSIRTLHLDFSSIQWRNDADITPFGHHLEKKRCLAEDSGLTFCFIDFTGFVEQRL